MTIFSRRARYTYGISMYLPFEDQEDDEGRRELNDDAEPYCRRFVPLVRVNDSIEVGKITRQVLYPWLREQNRIEINLLATKSADPAYPDDPGVTELGSLEVDISESSGRQNITTGIFFSSFVSVTPRLKQKPRIPAPARCIGLW